MSHTKLVYLINIEWDESSNETEALPDSYVFLCDSKDFDDPVEAAKSEAAEVHGFAIDDCDSKIFTEDL